MDEELKYLAVLALRNAFYTEFSALVNQFLEAGKGLDTDLLEMQMSHTANVYSRDEKVMGDFVLNIWTQNITGPGTTGHDTIVTALEDPRASAVRLCGKRVFERRDGEWRFVGE